MGEGSSVWQEAVRQARPEAERLNRLIEERNMGCPRRLRRPRLQLESETRRALGAPQASQHDSRSE